MTNGGHSGIIGSLETRKHETENDHPIKSTKNLQNLPAQPSTPDPHFHRQPKMAAVQRKHLSLMNIEKIQIGTTLEVFIGACIKEKAAAIKKGLAKGEIVIRDGVKTFHTHDAIFDGSKVGSEQYIWDKSGDRVKQNKILVTIAKDGTRTEEIIGTVFRKW